MSLQGDFAPSGEDRPTLEQARSYILLRFPAWDPGQQLFSGGTLRGTQQLEKDGEKEAERFHSQNECPSSPGSDLWQIPELHSQTECNQSQDPFQTHPPCAPRTIPSTEVAFVCSCPLFCEEDDQGFCPFILPCYHKAAWPQNKIWHSI